MHPPDGMHQIVWVARRHAAGGSFCVTAGLPFGFGEDAILTGEVSDINSYYPFLAGVPRWSREAGHRLAPHPLCLVQVEYQVRAECLARAEDPVDVRLRRRVVDRRESWRVVRFALVCCPRYQY
jgi:hypothetical protein